MFLARKNKFYLNAYRFFGDFLPILPFMAIFFAKQGLTISQISLLFLVWAGTIVIFEIPTGLLADKYNRKQILLLARFCKLACFLFWLAFPSFGGIMVGFIFWGIAMALDSGAFQAFVYDELKHSQRESEFIKVYARASSWSFVALFCAALFASFFVQISYTFLLIVTVASIILSIIFLQFLPNSKQVAVNHQGYYKIFKKSLLAIKKRQLILLLLIVGVSVGGIKGSLEAYFPLLLDSNQVPLWLIGMIIAGFESMKAIGSLIAGKLKNSATTQMILMLILGILFILLKVQSLVVILFLLLLFLIDAILWVQNDAYLQALAESDFRATLASLKSFGIEATGIVTLFTMSIVTKNYSITQIFLVAGVVLILLSIMLLLHKFVLKQRGEEVNSDF